MTGHFTTAGSSNVWISAQSNGCVSEDSVTHGRVSESILKAFPGCRWWAAKKRAGGVLRIMNAFSIMKHHYRKNGTNKANKWNDRETEKTDNFSSHPRRHSHPVRLSEKVRKKKKAIPERRAHAVYKREEGTARKIICACTQHRERKKTAFDEPSPLRTIVNTGRSVKNDQTPKTSLYEFSFPSSLFSTRSFLLFDRVSSQD
mmetsp:Transcript_27839/g.54582  ORF Transcript_27839/g.54582 Transcript_27839/m.54582 type:complete len:202 (-) Transcript_27839:2114-2719(-)